MDNLGYQSPAINRVGWRVRWCCAVALGIGMYFLSIIWPPYSLAIDNHPPTYDPYMLGGVSIIRAGGLLRGWGFVEQASRP